MLASYGESFVTFIAAFVFSPDSKEKEEGKKQEEVVERSKGEEREKNHLVDGPGRERQRLTQERVVPTPAAAVKRRDAVRERREEADEVARGLGAREGGGGRCRGCASGGGGIVGRCRRCGFQERELGNEPVFCGYFVGTG